MKLVKLNDEISVMPTAISEVQVMYGAGLITVRLASGVRYAVRPEYKQSITEAHARLLIRIDEALQCS